MAKKLVAFRLSEDVLLLLSEVAMSYPNKTDALEELIRIGVRTKQNEKKQSQAYSDGAIQK